MKAYKVTNPDYTCKDVLFEVGKTYSIKDKIVLCQKGFHFCRNLSNCFNYYCFDSNNKVLEIEVLGQIVGDEKGKECTNKLKVIKELQWDEVLKLCNTGDCNTGDWNTGNRNTGVFNIDNTNKYRVFGKWISEEKFNRIIFPDFLYFDLNQFISFDTATDKERNKYKKEIEVCGGF